MKNQIIATLAAVSLLSSLVILACDIANRTFLHSKPPVTREMLDNGPWRNNKKIMDEANAD